MFLGDFLKGFDDKTLVRIINTKTINNYSFYEGFLCNYPYWLIDFLIEENQKIVIDENGMLAIHVYEREEYMTMEVELKLKSLFPLIVGRNPQIKVINLDDNIVLYEGSIRDCPYWVAEFTFGRESMTSFIVKNNTLVVNLFNKEEFNY